MSNNENKKSPPQVNSKKKLLSYLKFALKWAIYIGVGYFIYSKLSSSYNDIEDFGNINWIWLALSIFIFSFHSIWNSFNWHYLIKSSGENVTKRSQLEVYMKSYLMRYVPGNVVGIMARGIYNLPYKVPMVKSLWGWFFENVIYLMIGIFIGGYVLLISDKDSGLSIINVVGRQVGVSDQAANILTVVIIVISLLFGLLLLVKNEWLRMIFEKLIIPKLPKGAQKEFASLDIKLKQRVALLGRYVIAWLIYSLSFIALLKGFDITGWDLLTGASINALAWSIGYMAIVTPSGTGIREAVMVVLLTGVMGVVDDKAAVIALFARFIFTVGELLGFVQFYMLKLFLYINDGYIK